MSAVKAQGELVDPIMWFEMIFRREIECDDGNWEGIMR
jgi:hypothetical protein